MQRFLATAILISGLLVSSPAAALEAVHLMVKNNEVLISTQTSVNAVRIILRFDPKAGRVKSLDTSASWCSLFIEKIIDNKTGRVIMSCGKPNPGFIGTGVIFGFRLAATVGQDAKLAIDPASQILANDGLGTKIPAIIKSLDKVIKAR